MTRAAHYRKFRNLLVHRTCRLTCQKRCSPCVFGPVGQFDPRKPQVRTVPCYEQLLQKKIKEEGEEEMKAKKNKRRKIC
jgi:hypothetical protein